MNQLKEQKQCEATVLQRRMVDLEKLGVPGVPLFGYTRSVRYGWEVDSHSHRGAIEIGLCLRGALSLENQGVQHSLMPGDIFVNKPEERHRLLVLPKGAVHYWIHLNLKERHSDFLGLSAAEIADLRRKLWGLPSHIVTDTTRVAAAFHRITRCLDTMRGAYQRFALRSCCMALVFEVAELSEREHTAPAGPDLSVIIRRIREFPERKIVLDDLARESALSTTGFTNAFKQTTGFPPLHYQLRCRLDAAKRLLKTTSASITSIAMRMGFSSSQHFSTHFKKMYGCTPSEYRQLDSGELSTSNAPKK